jgi:hypothetical protein
VISLRKAAKGRAELPSPGCAASKGISRANISGSEDTLFTVGFELDQVRHRRVSARRLNLLSTAFEAAQPIKPPAPRRVSD